MFESLSRVRRGLTCARTSREPEKGCGKLKGNEMTPTASWRRSKQSAAIYKHNCPPLQED